MIINNIKYHPRVGDLFYYDGGKHNRPCFFMIVSVSDTITYILNQDYGLMVYETGSLHDLCISGNHILIQQLPDV